MENEVNYQPLEDMKHAWLTVMKTALYGMAWPVAFMVTAIGIITIFKFHIPHVLFLLLGAYFSYIATRVAAYKNQIWDRFAEVNGWSFDTQAPAVNLLPPSLQFGHDQHFSSVIQAKINGTVCDLLNYNTTTGNGRDSKTHQFTVAIIGAPQDVPHLVLRAKRNEADLQKDIPDVETLKLEGDFNNYFRLELAKGNEIEALTIITPEVMQTLLYYSQGEDIELYGGNIYFIVRGDARNPQAIRQLITSVSELAHELNENAMLAGKQTAGVAASNSELKKILPAG